VESTLPSGSQHHSHSDDWRNIPIARFDFGRKSGPILGERNLVTSKILT
jgi:hypothetical protein